MESRSIDINEEIQEDEIFRSQEENDPLAEVEIFTESPTYYQHTETIFAEPIVNNNTIGNADDREADEICFIDNVIVHKRCGKRQKYYINVDMQSSSCDCPQTNCGKTFSSLTLLRAHIRKVHCANRNKFICERCASGFSAQYLLERHLAVHSGERVECPECGKLLSKRTRFPWRKQMANHGSCSGRSGAEDSVTAP